MGISQEYNPAGHYSANDKVLRKKDPRKETSGLQLPPREAWWELYSNDPLNSHYNIMYIIMGVEIDNLRCAGNHYKS